MTDDALRAFVQNAERVKAFLDEMRDVAASRIFYQEV